MKAFGKRALVLCAAAMLFAAGACAPRLVGEEAAREAGLTLIHQAFGVHATDAHVEYFERAGTSVLDNQEVRPGTNQPTEIYLVTISDPARGMDLYYAEVDARSGVAYYALKNEWLVGLLSDRPNAGATDTQSAQDQTDTLNGGASDEVFVSVPHRYQKEVVLISEYGGCQRGRRCASYTGFGYVATLADGALYRIGLSWPAPEQEETHSHRRGNNP